MWDGNGTNFAEATVKNAIRASGKNWVLLTNDYVWGHNTSKATRSCSSSRASAAAAASISARSMRCQVATSTRS